MQEIEGITLMAAVRNDPAFPPFSEFNLCFSISNLCLRSHMTHHLPLLLVSLRSFLPNRECYLDLFSSLHLLSAMSEHPRGSSYHGSSTPELRLVLLGNLGCGKTSSADTILGQLSRVSPAAARSCQQRQNIIEGRSVTLVEAPRWYWSGGRMEDSVRKETERAMTLVAPGPHAILLLVPVCQFTEVGFVSVCCFSCA